MNDEKPNSPTPEHAHYSRSKGKIIKALSSFYIIWWKLSALKWI